MALWYTLYTKMNCSKSTLTRELLQIMGADYYEVVLDLDDEWEVPVVFLEEDYIGGYKELRKHFTRSTKNAKKTKKSKQEQATSV